MELGRTKKILLAVIILILVAAAGAFIYFNDFYHSEELVNKYLESGGNVSVTHIEEGYYFKGQNNSDTAMIFYPGAKVEYTAYAPMMYEMAENGIDCFLIEMPFNMAFFGADKASSIIDNYTYSNYYVSGHSLGGVVASSFANENANKVKGVVLFAAYPSSKMDDKLKLLSIYGSDDGVLNMESYNENKKNWPDESEEFVIKGANHEGFAYYGAQDGDNNASITPEKQQDIAIQKILEFTQH
jgi:hypothetical protein